MHVSRNNQSPYTDADFWAQWSSATPRMAFFILVTPKSEFGGSAAAIGFTSNTRNMTLPGHAGITFKSTPGITSTTIEMVLDDPTNLELTGIYQSDSFVHSEVVAGKWSFATIEIFSSSWENVNLGEVLWFRGNLGEFRDKQTHFVAEARGLLARLSNDVNGVTSRFCRVHEFRDAQCGHTDGIVIIDAVEYNVVQTGVGGTAGSDRNELIFNTSLWDGNFPPPNILLANGKITCTSGANAGVSREIASIDEASGGYPSISLITKRPFPFPVTGTKTFDLVAGCDRTVEACIRFGNIINRRAEDYVPGIESANKVTTVSG